MIQYLLKSLPWLTQQLLQDKKLSLMGCRPRNLVVDPHPPHRVVVADFVDVLARPGFSPSVMLKATSLASSSIFKRDAMLYGPLKDRYIVKNLPYLSPEVVTGRFVTPASDIYAFGVSAYEILTGTAPGRGSSLSQDSDRVGGDDGVDTLERIHNHLTAEIYSPSIIARLKSATDLSTPHRPRDFLDQIVMKCLAKDSDKRYGSLDPVLGDLRTLAERIRSRDFADFAIGATQAQSHLRLPLKPVFVDPHLKVLDREFAIVQDFRRPPCNRSVNIFGVGGSGKSRLVTYWTAKVEAAGMSSGVPCLVGSAKLDAQIQKPVTSFIHIFLSLLDRVLTDPKEDAPTWTELIQKTLGVSFPILVSLLCKQGQTLVSIGREPSPVDAIDWSQYRAAFKLWSKRLLQLFATQERPLILVVDDIQWMLPDELDM